MTSSALTGNTSGLASATSPGLVGITTQTFAGKKTLDGGALIKGDTSGVAIAASYVGEVLNSTVSTVTNVGVSGQYFNATSLTLTAGTWLAFAGIVYTRNSATITDPSVVIAINGTTGNSSANFVNGLNSFDSGNSLYPTSSLVYIANLPSVLLRYTGSVLTLADGTTVTQTGGVIYLKGWSFSYTGGPPQYRCSITALRIL